MKLHQIVSNKREDDNYVFKNSHPVVKALQDSHHFPYGHYLEHHEKIGEGKTVHHFSDGYNHVSVHVKHEDGKPMYKVAQHTPDGKGKEITTQHPWHHDIGTSLRAVRKEHSAACAQHNIVASSDELSHEEKAKVEAGKKAVCSSVCKHKPFGEDHNGEKHVSHTPTLTEHRFMHGNKTLSVTMLHHGKKPMYHAVLFYNGKHHHHPITTDLDGAMKHIAGISK